MLNECKNCEHRLRSKGLHRAAIIIALVILVIDASVTWISHFMGSPYKSPIFLQTIVAGILIAANLWRLPWSRNGVN